jgi:hypothetical protein
MQANINARLIKSGWECRRFKLAREGSVPFAGAGTFDTDCLEYALQWTMQEDTDVTDFRQPEDVGSQLASARGLGIAEAIVPVSATKPWIPWRLSGLDSSEEGFEGKIYSDSHILKHLAVDISQRGPLCLESNEGVYLAIHTQGLSSFFPSCFALFQQMVIQPPALVQDMSHGALLCLRWIDTIFKHFMHMLIIAQNK